jgi:hypothetical protein
LRLLPVAAPKTVEFQACDATTNCESPGQPSHSRDKLVAASMFCIEESALEKAEWTVADRTPEAQKSGINNDERRMPVCDDHFSTVAAIPISVWICTKIDEMARPERFELPTSWFVARHSIQLSYGRAAV